MRKILAHTVNPTSQVKSRPLLLFHLTNIIYCRCSSNVSTPCLLACSLLGGELKFRTGSQSQDSTEFPTGEAAPALVSTDAQNWYPGPNSAQPPTLDEGGATLVQQIRSVSDDVDVMPITDYIASLLLCFCNLERHEQYCQKLFQVKISIEFTPMIWVPNSNPLTRRTEVKAIQPIKRRHVEGADDQDEVRQPEWHQ